MKCRQTASKCHLAARVKILEHFWNSARDSFILVDPDFNILRFNRSGLKKWKLKHSQIIVKNLLDLFPGLKNTDRLAQYRTVLRTGKPLSLKKVPFPRKSDTYVDIYAFKVGDALGMIVTDISKSYKKEKELIKSRQLLRDLSFHIQTLRENESKRIAREIHDVMAPTLTALKMDLSWLLFRLNEEGTAAPLLLKKIERMAELTDKTIESLQTTCAELRPVLLDDLGLFPALEWQVQEFQKRSQIRNSLRIDCNGLDFGPELSLCIFRIFQEALTNIIRHARATRVIASLRSLPRHGILELKIKDNGRGITSKQVSSGKSFGLIGMRERLCLFGGALKISGQPDRGTTLIATIPLPKP